IQHGLINAAHDISEGGVAVALAEMSFKNSMGVAVQINGELSADKLLFGETGGFILEIDKQNKAAFDKLVTQYQVPYMVIGHTTEQPVLQMNSVINLPVKEAKQAWENGLRERLL
ncbi:TPA: AIR synthase-related protein, partial [Legionella pneumophila]